MYTKVFQDEKLSLIKKRGVYPHDYMHSFIVCIVTPKEHFYSILIDKDISDVQYQHAQNVWNTFNMKERSVSEV